MPLYEYQCKKCGLQFERRQHFSDDPVKECPECGGEVVRLIQPAGIIFKGSGFYVTDNRAKSPTATPGTRQENQKVSEESSSPTEKSKSTAGDNGTS